MKLTIDRQKWCTGAFGSYAYGAEPYEDEEPTNDLFCCATGWLGMAWGASYKELEQATKTADFLPEQYDNQGARNILANIIDTNDDYGIDLPTKEADIKVLFAELGVDCEFVGERPSTGRLPDAS